MSRFEKFTEDEVYILFRQATESSAEIVLSDNSKSDVVYLIAKYISADLATEVEEYFDNKDIEEDIYYRFLDDLEIEFETLQDKFRGLRGEY